MPRHACATTTNCSHDGGTNRHPERMKARTANASERGYRRGWRCTRPMGDLPDQTSIVWLRFAVFSREIASRAARPSPDWLSLHRSPIRWANSFMPRRRQPCRKSGAAGEELESRSATADPAGGENRGSATVQACWTCLPELGISPASQLLLCVRGRRGALARVAADMIQAFSE
jgi:hypothetical protein